MFIQKQKEVTALCIFIGTKILKKSVTSLNIRKFFIKNSFQAFVFSSKYN